MSEHNLKINRKLNMAACSQRHETSVENNQQCDRMVNKYLFKVLKSLCNNNLHYFENDSSEYAKRFVCGFNCIIETVDRMELQVECIEKVAHHFDLDEKSRGNGFRSCLIVIDKCIKTTIKLSKTICLKRDSFLFRRIQHLKELENLVSVLGSLNEGCQHFKKLLVWNKKGELYPEDHQTAEDLLFEVECVDQASFYGRFVGFQFCESLQGPILFLSVLMATFCDAYLKSGTFISKAAISLVNATKYTLDPESRSQRIVEMSQNASTDLVKAYWNLAEMQFMTHFPTFSSPNVQVNKVIKIPVQCLEMPRLNGKGNTTIPIPRSYLEPAPIPCRLISYSLRKGQLTDEEKKAAGLLNVKEAPLSRDLILHIHGGGFLAMSSKSHEVYLREWAKDIDAPILSVDYTLAPKAPYPRALEECFMAYCWAIANCQKLGSTGERIIIAGDSAGGNLTCCVTLKTIQYGIRRPNGIVCIYTPFVMRALPSPSRFLSAFDPFLPIGFLLCVITAYAGLEIPVGRISNADGSTTNMISTTPKSPLSPNDTQPSFNAGEEKPGQPSFSLQFLSSEDEEMSVEDIIADKYEELVINSETDKNLRVDLDKDLESVILSPVPKTNNSDSSSDLSTLNKQTPTSNDSYVNEFLDEYVNKQILDEDKNGNKPDDEEQVLFELPTLLPTVKSVPRRIFHTTKNILRDLSAYFIPQKSLDIPLKRRRTISRPFLDHPLATGLSRFSKMETSFDPQMSPYFATDETLMEMPPVYLESPHLDPIMDDSVMFAKRLRKLGKPVHIDFFDDVPHAFLNLITLSKEARDCNRTVMLRLRQALNGDLSEE
ncbi:Hormone-sensitive lipase [Nymphon striatum]|nr:Hormone-sensitive lipase [Nymphon striatum]